MSQITLTNINNGDTSDASIAMANWNALKNRINLGMESDNIAANAVNGSHINLGAYIFKQSKGADVASAATVVLGNDGNFFDITGTTTITSITAKSAGTVVQLQFDGILTLTNGSNLKLSSTMTTAANSTIALVSDGTNWYEIGRSPVYSPTAANALSGSVIQTVYAQTTDYTSVSSTIPEDDSIPQNTEGVEILTASITPNNASNYLVITVTSSGSNGTGAQDVFGGIFQDSTASAIAAGSGSYPVSGECFIFSLVYRMTAGTTSSTTFKFRIGTDVGSPLYVNGRPGGSGRRFGGTNITSILIEEIKA